MNVIVSVYLKKDLVPIYELKITGFLCLNVV